MYSELTPIQKSVIVRTLDLFIRTTSEQLGVCPTVVAAASFYRLQRHPEWGRNPTRSQKTLAYKHWGGVCQHPKCMIKDPIKKNELTFHHLIRGIPDQHSPHNLVPMHILCHDDEHNAISRSLATGSPPRKPTTKRQTKES